MIVRPALDRYALGRQLSMLSNCSSEQLLERDSIATTQHRARRIGITGAPGAGKSTLTGLLAMHRLQEARVGVLAVDPSSPRSGGAILGDRIRMDDLAASEELYIRSVGSRSTTDGLSDNLPEMLDVFDAHGFDEVLLETVGVGQAEYAARCLVDTLALVLLPDSGDAVQAMKSGIMEMADIFVVNKADLPGAQRMVADLQRIAAVSRKHSAEQWRPTVLLTSAKQADSIQKLSAEIDRHQQWLRSAEQESGVQAERARYRLRRIVERQLSAHINQLPHHALRLPLPQQIALVLSQMASNH